MTLYVNNEPIENTLIEAEISRLRPDYQRVFKHQSEQEQQQQLAEWARENVIEAVLFRQQAQKTFPQIEPSEIQAVLGPLLQREGPDGPLRRRMQSGDQEKRKLYDEIAEQIRHEKLHSQITQTVGQPSEKKIRQYYERHLAERFTIPAMVHAAHIVKHSNAEETKEQQYQQLCQIKEKLDGGVPFEELAQAHSDCPDSSGDLGFFTRGKMVPAFEEVVFELESGSCSDVFETEFGWHIAKVIEKRPPVPCPLDQVREVIIRDLTQEAQEKALEKFLDEQKEKARIEER